MNVNFNKRLIDRLSLGILLTLLSLVSVSCQGNGLGNIKVSTPTPTAVPDISLPTATSAVVQVDEDNPVLNQELQPTPTPFVYSPKQGVPEDLTYDLIWLEPDEGVVKRLSRKTGEVTTFLGSGDDAEIFISGKIWKYVTNETARNITVVAENINESDQQRTFRLYDVNLSLNRVRLIYEVPWEWDESQPFKAIMPSPDGVWIAFIEWQYRVMFTGQDVSQHVAAVVRTDGVTAPIVFDTCLDDSFTGCFSGPILWAPDSLRLTWQGGGVWLGRIGSQARVIVGNKWEERTAIIRTRYSPSAWSQSGQYILFDIEDEDGKSIGVFDTQLSQIAEVPRSDYGLTDPKPAVIWLNDDRLLMLRGLLEEETGEIKPTMMLVRLLLSSGGIGFETTNVPLEGDLGSYVFAPFELPYRRITFASMDYHAGNSLWFDELKLHDMATYIFDVTNLQEGVYLGSIPDCDNRLHTCGWLPDGSAMFFRSLFAYKDLYIPVDGGEVYDLRPLIGDTGCCFNWIH